MSSSNHFQPSRPHLKYYPFGQPRAANTMAHRIIVRTEKRRPDSLREPVQIVFTLTPADSEGYTRSYDPVALGHMVFPVDSEDQQSYEWGPELAFNTYTTLSHKGRNTCIDELRRVETPPGQTYNSGSPYYTATSSSSGNDSLLVKEPSVKAVNNYGDNQRFVLQVRNIGSHFNSIVAYHPLAYQASVIASAGLLLQAYVVDGEGNYNGDILTPEQLTRPLFDKPLDCKFLPETSAWKLSQDPDGKILLNPDDGQKPTMSGSFELIAESVNDLRHQLSAVLASLDATQQRLTAVETAVTHNHANLSTALNTTREQVSQLDRVVPAMQAKVAEFEEFVGRVRHRPVASGSSSRNQRAGSDRGVSATVAGDSSSVTLGQEGTAGHGVSASRARGHSTPVTASIGTITEPSSDIETRGDSQSGSEPRPTEPRDAGANTAGQTELPGSARLPQAQATVDEAPGHARSTSHFQDSLRILRQQVAGLDRRVPALEAKAENLARGFGQTLENLAFVHKFLQTTREQVTGLRSGVPVMEQKIEHLTESIVTTDDYLADLTSRLITVEERAETLSESLADIRDSRAGSWPSFSPTDNPSAGFPSGIAETSRSLATFAADSPPWLPLPHPLDTELDGNRMNEISPAL